MNDGKQMGARRLPLPRDDGDGCLAPEARRHTIGRCHVALHGRKRRISVAGENSLLYDPRISRSPQLLGQDFDVNFATYTRVYTVFSFSAFKPPTSIACDATILYSIGLHITTYSNIIQFEINVMLGTMNAKV